MRKFCAAAIAVAAAVTATGVAFMPGAEAATVTKHGIKVVVPASVKAYNGKKASVKPTAKVSAGVNESVTGLKILVYKGKKKIASGRKVKLKVGRYTQRVKVTYKSWTYVTKTGTKRVLRDPDDVADYGSASSVTCRVTQVDGDGWFVAGTCTSPNYPGQTVTIDETSWCSSTLGFPLVVGETVTDNFCYDNESNFKPYYVTVPVQTKVKSGIRSHAFMTAKKKLKVVDGGHLRGWSGGPIHDDDGVVTKAFTTPSHWKLEYAYVDTADDFGCFFYASVYKYQDGDWVYYDNVINEVDQGNSGRVKYRRGAGKMRVEIDSNCDGWAVLVQWK